ncbi:unnamed protein product, partial [Mesorhabditis spiculigera]
MGAVSGAFLRGRKEEGETAIMSSSESRSNWSFSNAFTLAWANLLAVSPKKGSVLNIEPLPPRNSLRRISLQNRAETKSTDTHYLHSYGSLNLP